MVWLAIVVAVALSFAAGVVASVEDVARERPIRTASLITLFLVGAIAAGVQVDGTSHFFQSRRVTSATLMLLPMLLGAAVGAISVRHRRRK